MSLKFLTNVHLVFLTRKGNGHDASVGKINHIFGILWKQVYKKKTGTVLRAVVQVVGRPEGAVASPSSAAAPAGP